METHKQALLKPDGSRLLYEVFHYQKPFLELRDPEGYIFFTQTGQVITNNKNLLAITGVA